MCLAQRSNMADVGFEPKASRFAVLLSTTLPRYPTVLQCLSSLYFSILPTIYQFPYNIRGEKDNSDLGEYQSHKKINKIFTWSEFEALCLMATTSCIFALAGTTLISWTKIASGFTIRTTGLLEACVIQ